MGLSLLIACTYSPAPDPAMPARVEAAVRPRLASFLAAERARDADAVLEHLHYEFYMYQDGTRVDYTTVSRQIRDFLPALREFETEFENIEVLALSKNAALTTMTFRDRVTAADGSVKASRGPTTMLWQRVHGVWKLTFADADHYPLDR